MKPYDQRVAEALQDSSYLPSDPLVQGTVPEAASSSAPRPDEEEGFRVAFEQLPVGMGVVTLCGTFRRVNEAFASMVGYLPEELAGKSVADITHPTERHTATLEIKRLIEGEIEWLGRTKKYLHRDGRSVWGELTASIVRDVDQAPIYLAFVCKDITRERSLEMQLHASQRMEAVGRLARGMAHDFNNLLTVILGCGSFALDGLTEGTSTHDDVSQIIGAAERAARLTSQLLAFSRRQLQELQTVDLNGIILGLEDMLQRLMGEHIEVGTRLEPELGLVTVDVTQIEQILLNLALNARDAMPRGGEFIIETTNEVIDDESSRSSALALPHGLYVRLTAKDTGAGIPSEIQPNVFDPFFTTKEAGKGTGLGLSTVYGIVKQCHGFIWLDSEVDRGTTFTIHLPRSEAQETDKQPYRSTAGRLGTETVLVVEDEAALRRVARRALEESGYRVLEACDGEDGLRVAEQHDGPIDLLLTDVLMPGMSGSQVVEKLARQRPDMRIIYMSGHNDETLVVQGVAGEDTVVLRKPFTPEDLVRRVGDVLDRSHGDGAAPKRR